MSVSAEAFWESRKSQVAKHFLKTSFPSLPSAEALGILSISTLRKEKFEQTLQGKDQPTMAPSAVIVSAALHSLCLPSLFLISFHHKQICKILFHLLGFLPYGSFICPAKQQQYGTYFPSPSFWDEPVTWCFNWEDASRKKGQNFGGKWGLWTDDDQDIEHARRDWPVLSDHSNSI